MTILIPGGTGFIGSNLCNFLVNINDKNEVDKFIILHIRLSPKDYQKDQIFTLEQKTCSSYQESVILKFY